MLEPLFFLAILGMLLTRSQYNIHPASKETKTAKVEQNGGVPSVLLLSLEKRHRLR
jgi:hypothetical protein